MSKHLQPLLLCLLFLEIVVLSSDLGMDIQNLEFHALNLPLEILKEKDGREANEPLHIRVQCDSQASPLPLFSIGLFVPTIDHSS